MQCNGHSNVQLAESRAFMRLSRLGVCTRAIAFDATSFVIPTKAGTTTIPRLNWFDPLCPQLAPPDRLAAGDPGFRWDDDE